LNEPTATPAEEESPMKTEINITVRLNGKTCQPLVSVYVHGNGETFYSLSGVKLVTSHGSKTHMGTIGFRAHEDPTHVYTAKDITDASYWGMRGNGHAVRSTFRYIGF
jgi:hypothetical protein